MLRAVTRTTVHYFHPRLAARAPFFNRQCGRLFLKPCYVPIRATLPGTRCYSDQNSDERTQQPQKPTSSKELRENIYTLPNVLTVSRILSCPLLGWSILQSDFHLATGILIYAGLTDLADGYLARRYNMSSVIGTILDPAADKALMTTLAVTLTVKGMLPVPLAVIILGRDVLLSLSAFYIRYTSLPPPKTFTRYWDFSIPSAEVKPTFISKINTFLQLGLMGATTISPLLPFEATLPLQGLQWIVATTTIWSGLSYLFSKDAVRVISQKRRKGSEHRKD